MYRTFYKVLALIVGAAAVLSQLQTIAHVWLYSAIGAFVLVSLKSLSLFFIMFTFMIVIWWRVSPVLSETWLLVEVLLEYILGSHV